MCDALVIGCYLVLTPWYCRTVPYATCWGNRDNLVTPLIQIIQHRELSFLRKVAQMAENLESRKRLY